MILIVAEHADGRLGKSASEMTQAARDLGREGPITLLVLGSGVAGVAASAALLADQVLVADTPDLADVRSSTSSRPGYGGRISEARRKEH